MTQERDDMKDEIRSQFRIPGEVGAWLKELAESNFRSMNGQLVAVLKEKMDATKEKTLIDAGKL